MGSAKDWWVKDGAELKRFVTFSAAEKYARAYVERRLKAKGSAPRIAIFGDSDLFGAPAAYVTTDADGRVWTDLVSGAVPV